MCGVCWAAKSMHRLLSGLYSFAHVRCRNCCCSFWRNVVSLDGPYECFVEARVHALLIAPREGERCCIDRQRWLKACPTSHQRGNETYDGLKAVPCVSHRARERPREMRGSRTESSLVVSPEELVGAVCLWRSAREYGEGKGQACRV